MKLKKEYILLAAVIIGLGAYLIFQKTDRTHYRLPEPSKISKDDISKIEIKTADRTIEIKKKDGAWVIGPKAYPADADRIKEMLETIAALKLTALISESKNYVRYDLNESKRLAVKAFSGNSLLREFDIGKTAPTYQHTFVKLADDPNVYHARGYFRTKFDQSVDDLRDLRVLSFEKVQIQDVEIVYNKETYHLSRETVSEKKADEKAEAGKAGSDALMKKAIWQTTAGKPVDSEKLDSLLSTLSDLECDSYVEDAKKEDFKDPIFSITLKGAKEYRLAVFPKIKEDASEYPAVSSENPYVFLLSGNRVDTFKRTVEPEKKEEKK